MIVPVVLGDIDPGAIEQLITCCVEYDRIRSHAHHGADSGGSTDPDDAGHPAGTAAEVLAMLEHQILATVIQIVSGPGGVASFLRRHLLGKGLNGPVPPPGRRADRRHPRPPAPPGRAARPDLPVPRRLRPARVPVPGPSRDPPRRRRAHQPVEYQGLLLVASPRGVSSA